MNYGKFPGPIFALSDWRDGGAQRTILHDDKAPVTQAGSRLRAKPAPEGHGLDAAGVEGKLTSRQGW